MAKAQTLDWIAAGNSQVLKAIKAVSESSSHLQWTGNQALVRVCGISQGRLLTFDKGRATQKAAFPGELFIADSRADPQGTLFRDFFQIDRDGRRKGIVVIDLKGLP